MTELTEKQIDFYIATQLRTIRALRNTTQTELGEALGISFQQVQKYERGENRLPSSKLCRAALFLDVPVSALYGNLCQPGFNNPTDLTDEEIKILRTVRKLKNSPHYPAIAFLLSSLEKSCMDV